MKWLFLFSIFATAAFSQNIYQQHLPSNIYQQIVQGNLDNENNMEIVRVVKYGELADTITVRFSRDEEESVTVDYWCGQDVDDFRGMQVLYCNGKMVAFAIFDGVGRDYVGEPPFSEEDEKTITEMMLDLIQGGYQKMSSNMGE